MTEQQEITPPEKMDISQLEYALEYRLVSLLKRQGKNTIADLIDECPCMLLNLRNIGQLAVNRIKYVVRLNRYEFAPCSENVTRIKNYRFQYPDIRICENIDAT